MSFRVGGSSTGRSPKPNSNEALLMKDSLSKSEIQFLINRMNKDLEDNESNHLGALALINGIRGKVTPDGNEGFGIGAEQTAQGLAWLKKHQRDLDGRQKEILDHFDHFRFVGTEERRRYGLAGSMNSSRVPVYRVFDSAGSSFDYVGAGTAKVEIVR